MRQGRANFQLAAKRREAAERPISMSPWSAATRAVAAKRPTRTGFCPQLEAEIVAAVARLETLGVEAA
jgi:hypothetical protein